MLARKLMLSPNSHAETAAPWQGEALNISRMLPERSPRSKQHAATHEKGRPTLLERPFLVVPTIELIA
jgi:hypothetical protein